MFFKNNSKNKTSKKPINENIIIYKSKIPEYIDSANKIYNKQYDSAIKSLKLKSLRIWVTLLHITIVLGIAK